MTVPAYPLQWPPGWRRTEKGARTTARFSKQERQTRTAGDGTRSSWTQNKPLTIADAVKRVREVLTLMGVGDDDLVISSNLALRLDGMPRSAQAEPADPGVAVYWRDRGATLSMAIDRYDRVADNLAAVAATLDGMRVIERHGGAEILDRAYQGFTALPSPDSTPWFVEFGFDSRETVMSMAQHDAGEEMRPVKDVLFDIVKRAYQRRRRETHPDGGGTDYEFQRTERAWEQFKTEEGHD